MEEIKEFYLPAFKNEWMKRGHMKGAVLQDILDARTHVLATILALYPFTPTNDIAQEFGLTPKMVSQIAAKNGVRKTAELRSTINAQNGTHPSLNKNKVSMVDDNGEVVTEFSSLTEAKQTLKHDTKTLKEWAARGKRIDGLFIKIKSNKG